MTGRRRPSAPTFRSANILGGGPDAPLPRRRLGRILTFSIVMHVSAGAGLIAMSLLSLDAVPPPPIIVTFLAPAPPPPPLLPLREERVEPATPPPPPPKMRPRPKQITQPRLPPPVILRPAEPARRPEPPTLEVNRQEMPIRSADAAPEVRIHDTAPPAPRSAPPEVGRVGAADSLLPGGGEEPELAFLVPGEDRRRGRGGGLAGRGDGLPPLRGGDPIGGIRRNGGGSGPGGDGSSALASERAFDGAGLGSFLGRKYGVTLVEARRLGQRTSDGSRYALLLPMLNEAYRGISFRGRRRGPAGDAVESVLVDDDAIAIRYRDGTMHVLVPTEDGLVGLYISADPESAGSRSKVDEAERALGALNRFMHAGRRG